MGTPIDYRELFERSTDAQLLLDRALTILAASDGYLHAVGQPRKDVLGRSVLELPPYVDARDAMSDARAVIDLVWQSRLPQMHRLETGLQGERPVFWRARSTPIVDATGVMQYVLHQLDAASSAELTASASERRLHKLIQHSYDAIALFNTDGRAFYISPSIERVSGYTEQEFKELLPASLVHPDDLPRFGREIQALFDRPGGVLLTQFRNRRRDGAWQVLECVSVNLLHDPDIMAVVSTFRDITQRVALEEELRKSHDRLRVALGSARAISSDWDLVAQRSSYSRDFAEYFGIAPAAYDGMLASAAVHPDDRELITRETERCLATGEDFDVEFRGVQARPEQRWYASHGQVFRDQDGRAVRMVGVTWDITERRRLQQERELLEQRMRETQKLESLGVLAGGVAHDFNNILMAILGNANLLGRSVVGDAAASASLAQIEEAARRASDLCRQMLAYAGKGRFVLERTNVNQLIEETTHLLQVSISKKSVLRLELDRQLPCVVADATQIRQVLMNLVINASDAIGEREGEISITTSLVHATRMYLDRTYAAPEIGEGDYVCLEVSDTGIGMSAETRARMFEPFFSTKFTGRGLGLAAVLGIVRGHRGALEVSSEPGKGSNFKLLLPVDRGSEAPAPAPDRYAELTTGHGTILVVDDEQAVRAVTRRMLELGGFAVIEAVDGREAIAIYREQVQQIRGVLMDLTMPRFDGEEALRELRRINPDVRVLLMSGYDEQETVSRFIGQGLAGFIQKPFSIDGLLQQLQRLLL